MSSISRSPYINDKGNSNGERLYSCHYNRTTPTKLVYDCREQYPNFFLQADDGTTINFRCKTWRCKTCYPNNMKKQKYKVMALAERFKMRFYWVLTIPQDMPLYESWDYIQDCWNKFLIVIRRKYGKKLDFIRVNEAHKSGYPHINFLTNRYINVRWLRKQWQSLGGGYRNRVEYVSIKRVAAYLSKYLSKVGCHLPKGYRHNSLSREVSLVWKQIKYTSEKKSWQLLCMVWVDLKGFGHIEIIREVCQIDWCNNYVNLSKPPPNFEYYNLKLGSRSKEFDY